MYSPRKWVQSLNFGATEIKSQAYAPPIWHDRLCLPRLPPARDFFATGERVFSVRKLLRMIFKYQNVCQGLGLRLNLRFWVFCAH